MEVEQVIELAQQHILYTPSSAGLCLADAINLLNKGDKVAAKHRALKSLRYSVGVFHRDYLKAIG